MKHNSIFFIIFFSVFFLSNQAFAAETALVTEKQLQEQIKRVENNNKLAEEEKHTLLEYYSKTIGYLADIEKYEHQSKIYIHAKKQAPEKILLLEKQLLEIEKQLDLTKQLQLTKKLQPKEISSVKTTELVDLEQFFNSESANLAAVQAKHADLVQTLNNETEGLVELRTRLLEAKHSLETLLEDKELPQAGISENHKKAGKWLLDSHISAIRSEIKMLDNQLLTQPIRARYSKLKIEISNYKLNKITRKVDNLKQQVDLKRSLEVKKTEEITREQQSEAKGKHEVILALAKRNSQLSKAISEKTRELSELESADDLVIKETQRLMTEMGNTRKKLKIAGLSQILGQMLLEQKAQLPDSRLYKKNLKKRESILALTGLQHIQYQEEFSKIKNKDTYLSKLLVDVSADETEKISVDLLRLISTRKDLLHKAITTDESYLRAINEVDFVEKKLIIAADEYAEFLDKHLFWLRNAPLVNINDLKKIPRQMSFFFSSSKWSVVAHDFIQLLRSSIEMSFSFILLLLFLFKAPQFKLQIIRMGKKTRRVQHDSLIHTLKAMFYTLLLTLPLPAFLYFSAWQLSQVPGGSEPSLLLSTALKNIAIPLFSLLFMRNLCISRGVADAHFNWSESLMLGVRKEMWRLMLTLLPLAFITSVLISRTESSFHSGLGRMALLLTLITLMIAFYRFFKPETGYLRSLSSHHMDGFFGHYQKLWFYLSMAGMFSLMALNIIGYLYTAVYMTISLLQSIWFIWGLLIIQQLVVRWLLLIERKYALQKVYEKREAYLQSQKVILSEEELENKEQILDFEEPEIDLVSLSEESKQLLNMMLFISGLIGLAAIWSDVLPALGIFEQVTLWHHTGVVAGVEKLLPITLADLALALLIAIISILAAKRLPAIIEILLLQNTRVSSGDRYTITTLINYAIVGTGFFSVFNIMGAEWARFQWLFAALSLGIGFGLQEIVANFISGIIILFERPIRVGDYVTVGDNEGVVSRIQIRATTILTRDRKELLVPNKEFITQQLLNWSLSDNTTRLKLPVGIAYGSDFPMAKEILLDIAQKNDRVLDDPMPRVVFYNFGDNSLDLQLRCFIDDVDFRLQTISELNEMINERFNEAGISISFPQRDVHLDINQPIDIRLQGKEM